MDIHLQAPYLDRLVTTIFFIFKEFIFKIFYLLLFLAAFGSSFWGFLSLPQARALSLAGVLASHCGSFFRCGARALGCLASRNIAARSSIVGTCGLQSSGSVAVART